MTTKILLSLILSVATAIGAPSPGQLIGVSLTTNALPSSVMVSPPPSTNGASTNLLVPGKVFAGDLVSTNLGASKIPVTDATGQLVPLNIGSGLSQVGTNLDVAASMATDAEVAAATSSKLSRANDSA